VLLAFALTTPGPVVAVSATILRGLLVGLQRPCAAALRLSCCAATRALPLPGASELGSRFAAAAASSARMGKEGKKKEDGKKKKDETKTEKLIGLEPPSGTRDFFPAEMRQQRYIFNKFRETANLYGFQEYDAPVLEHQELYIRKQGEEITDQMYSFDDKEGAKVTLRPEMTPTLARMVLNLMRVETGEMAAQLPLKWFSIPQCWRFETTQRGRKREHYQWNMDIVGVTSIYAEAELLSAICNFFESVGITSKDVGLRVNSRKVLNAVTKLAGVPDDRFAETCVIIDKLDKIGAEAVKTEMREKIGLPEEVGERIVKATGAKSLEEFADLAGVGQNNPEVLELKHLFELAEDYGYGDWLIFDASVVRGLGYYTGVVFEGFDRAGVLRAICGGGRYDRLLTKFGSPKEIPCVGFGFGDCVIAELLKEKGVTPSLPEHIDFVVAAFNSEMMGKAMNAARRLRLGGKSVDIFTEPGKKVGKAFNYADRVGADMVAFIAPDEWAKGLVRIKALRMGQDVPDDQKQKDVPLEDLANVDSYFGLAPAAAPVMSAAPAASTVKSTAPALAVPAAAKASAPKAAAPSGTGADVEAFLVDHPYVGGFRPCARDRTLFDELRLTSGRPSTPALGRWYDHIDSFPAVVRASWC